MDDFSIERLTIQDLVAAADRIGCGDQVPDFMREYADGHTYNGGAVQWDRLHPDDPQFYGCCDGEMIKGARYCICWVPVYDQEQAPPIPPGDGEIRPRDTLCGDCAYRPDSPEMSNALDAETLRSLPLKGRTFFCHEGMRRVARWDHPDGRTVPGAAGDYRPTFDPQGRPYQANGRVGLLCAGWAACSRAIDNRTERDERKARRD